MKRRDFLKSTSLAGGAVLAGLPGGGLAAEAPAREFYEWRTYEMQTGNRKAVLHDYLEKAYVPALNRLGAKPVGVFAVVSGANELNLYVLTPHPTIESLVSVPAKLADDAEYRKAAAPYLSAAIENPAYVRYETTLLRAFPLVPRLRVPAETAGNKPRILEVRVYESHSEAAAIKKIEMFNEGGEIGIFDRVGVRSVFFGQTLIGTRQPNLVYMTVHQDMAAREKAWAEFQNSPEWTKLRADPAFANTVSGRHLSFLKPTAYSQI